MTKGRFKKAVVIGTGMMGPGIAISLALGGVETVILSRTPDGAAQGMKTALGQIALLEENGLAAPEAARWAREHVRSTAAFDAEVAQADLVIESAPENMEFKQELFARLDALAKPDAVLGSNTSGLSITAVASRCTHPERVLTTHFWNPPHLMKLVEIVQGARTSPEVAAEIRALLIDCGKVPVMVKKDRPGQLGNRLQLALMREAIHIVEEGIADVEDVDMAAKAGFGLRLPVYGIFEHQDVLGLDFMVGLLDYIGQDLCCRPGAPDLVRDMVAAGRLGVKSGTGFYDWSKKDVQAVKARRDQFVLDFMKAQRGKA